MIPPIVIATEAELRIVTSPAAPQCFAPGAVFYMPKPARLRTGSYWIWCRQGYGQWYVLRAVSILREKHVVVAICGTRDLARKVLPG